MSRQSDVSAVGKPYLDRADVIIIGNGIAGLTAAVEVRRLEPEKQVIIITAQNHPTINTPALKQFAIGKLTREQLLAYPAGTEQAECIHIFNAHVESIHARSKYVQLTGGLGVSYDSLLIATGSKPTGLPAELPGRDFDGVLTLHRLNDYLDLRRRLPEVEAAVVIGGGAHAIETVMGLLHWGIQVHWLVRGDTFLAHMLDRPASDIVLERIQRAGAKVYTETEAVGIVGRVGVVAGVFTNQNQIIPCQLVLVCTGTTPVTTLATHCDILIQHKQGILVNDELRTSVPDIYAAGDVAALKNPLTGAYAPRAQWYAAVLQGRRAAASMTGHDQHKAEPFGVPWHATQLGELSMLTVGNPLSWTEGATVLTDTSRGGYRRLSIVDDQLVGYLSLSSTQPDSLAIKRLIDEGFSIGNIKKPLLKGEFDARRYFSQQQSHLARGMVTTGKLPPPAPSAAAHTQGQRGTRLLPTTGPVAVPPAHSTDPYIPAASTHGQQQEGTARITEPLVTRKITPHSPSQHITAERDPATDNIPVPVAKVVESTLVALPARPTQHVARGLHSYNGEAALHAHQFIAPVASTPVASVSSTSSSSLEPSSPPTRSLWYYTDKLPVVKQEKSKRSQLLVPNNEERR